jgi:hypothetical protein
VSFLTEISTPFLNYRSLMLTQRQQDSLLFKLNLGVFGALFFAFRVLFYPVIIYRGVQAYALIDVKKQAFHSFII